MEAANRLLLLGSQLPGQARAGVQTLLVQSRRPWENCAMWAAAWGVLALLKRHFGLAIEVGRQGQEQARQRRRSLQAKWLSPTPHLSSLLLVTRRKATLLLIPFQESIPGKTATCPDGPEAAHAFTRDRLRLQTPREGVQSTVVVQQWAWRRGLRVPTALSPSGEGVRRRAPWAASLAGRPVVQVQNICPTHGYL